MMRRRMTNWIVIGIACLCLLISVIFALVQGGGL